MEYSPHKLQPSPKEVDFNAVSIRCGEVVLKGDLEIPPDPSGIVLFAHGSGSSRQSPRNRFAAEMIRRQKMGTLLIDLLTREEEEADFYGGHLRFDIDFLASRLVSATLWLSHQREAQNLHFGYFGASTGGAAALVAAAQMSDLIDAVVSRGGRPDLAWDSLRLVPSPVLLIVGENDKQVLELNRVAYEELLCEKRLEIVPGATHLFEEPGALEGVSRLAAQWFVQHFKKVKAISKP
jgi:dienelactone hydrolase